MKYSGNQYFYDQELKSKVRIKNVYSAVTDVHLKPFVGQYIKFKGTVQRTTLNNNENWYRL